MNIEITPLKDNFLPKLWEGAIKDFLALAQCQCKYCKEMKTRKIIMPEEKPFCVKIA